MKKRYKILTVIIMVVTLVSLLVTQCAAYTYTGESGTYYVPDEFFGDVTRWDSSFDFSSGYYDFIYNTDPEQWATASYQGFPGVTLTNNFIDNYAKFEQAQTEFAGFTDFSVDQPKFGFQIPLPDSLSVVFEFDVSCYGAEMPNFQLVADKQLIYDSGTHYLSSWSKAVTTLDIYDPDQDTIVPVEMSIFSIHFVVTVSSDGSVSTVATTPHSDSTSTVTNSFTPSGYGILNFGLQLVGESYLWSYFGIGDTDAWSRGFPGMGIGLVPDISKYSSLDKYRKVKIVSLEISEDDKEAFFDSVVDDIVAGETAELKEKAADYDTLYQQYQSLDSQFYTATQRIASLEAEISTLEAEIERLEVELDYMTDARDEFRDEYLAWKEEATVWRENYNELNAEYSALNDLYEQKIEEKKALQNEIDIITKQNDLLTQENLSLEDENSSLKDENQYLSELNFELKNSNALDEIFTGTSDGLLTIIRGVADLGYTTSGGVSVTVGGLLTVAVLGAFIIFILRLVMSGGGK